MQVIETKRIHIVCPICSKFKRMPVSENIFNFDEGSLLKLPIKRGQMCDHEFLVVLDYNFSVRDYEIPSKRNDFLRKYFQGTKSNNLAADFLYF